MKTLSRLDPISLVSGMYSPLFKVKVAQPPTTLNTVMITKNQQPINVHGTPSIDNALMIVKTGNPDGH